MPEESPITPQPTPAAPRWRPLGAIDRRVLGVLAEKAKTTPDAYPMSLNAIVSGCNQKSNRAPLMQLEADDVQESLDRLREMGAVGMIEGYGRVAKYRHYLYEWLGVEKLELSVMTELLLRGSQTEGELRGRASRMDPIADLSALRTILVALRAKSLVLSLTPEGRGHVVTHALYPPRELEQLKVQYGQRAPAGYPADEEAGAAPVPRATSASPVTAAPPPPAAPSAAARESQVFESLRRQVEDLRGQVAQLTEQVQEMADQQERIRQEFDELRRSLGG